MSKANGHKKRGRPLRWEEPSDLEAALDAYFAACEESGEPFTVTGMAVHLRATRQTIFDYEQRPAFSDIVKKAKARCEHDLFLRALTGKVDRIVAIFGLKANHHWKDEHTVNVRRVEEPEGTSVEAALRRLQAEGSPSLAVN